MSIKIALWRLDDDRPVPLKFTGMDVEERLERMIVADPSLLGPERLLLLASQVVTDRRKRIDVLALDEEARVHVIELKRDGTSREVVAQVLEYAWWVRSLTLEDARDLWAGRGHDERPLDEAFHDMFERELDEEVFNAEQRLVVVGAKIDESTRRIVEYLADDYGVPINATAFAHFEDQGTSYLARTWLRPPEEDDRKVGPKRAGRGQQPAWNGRDLFVPLGRLTDTEHRRWEPALRYGFVSAGGGRKYWETFEIAEAGMRVFAYVAKAGYVGIGEVMGPVRPLAELQVEVDGEQRRYIDLPDCPAPERERALQDDPDISEYAVPVRWVVKVPVEEGFYAPGLRAQQLPCRLKHPQTIDAVEKALAWHDSGAG